MIYGSCGWTGLNLTHTAMMGLQAIGSDVYIAGMTSGAQQFVIKSTDSGNTFMTLNVNTHALMTFATTFQTTTSGIATGLAMIGSPNTFTTDGNNFSPSNGTGFMTAAQSCQNIVGVNGGFGTTGQHGNGMGVQVSSDGGKTYKLVTIPATSEARYGAFPSASTWYVAYGTWPQNASSTTNKYNDDRYIYLSQKYKIRSPNAETSRAFRKKRQSAPQPDGYWAQIMLTTDAGATFSSVYINETFYFNDIRCPNVKTCFVVGENEQWAVVYATYDGGATWSQVLYDPSASLMSASFTSETDWWACGAGFVPGNAIGHAWHSTDAGKTWSLTTQPGAYFFACSMSSATKGYATAGNAEGSMQLFGYNA
jgi:hypothetical protein